ncbi:DEKNAAC104249 [Brettanomyces naardenensis]|uniref:DEKNAAC104249 n=1 Tax=Brettanomyces naardenensis TaxID=13370 RepID=A0A448YQG4_BRENA|nr:DEKNAAC104249 [Brettanomyces naardenensis]
MTSIKPFHATDLFDLNPINLDPLTENFFIYFYLEYLSEWPTLFYKSTSALNTPTGYMLAKTEGQVAKKEWHAHISAVTIDPNYRRIGLGSYLCKTLETYTQEEKPYNAFFIDLFVKCNNTLAITFYEKLGYSVYRRVVGYYGGGRGRVVRNKVDDDVDAFDMRKSLRRDKAGECVRRGGRKVRVLPGEVSY